MKNIWFGAEYVIPKMLNKKNSAHSFEISLFSKGSVGFGFLCYLFGLGVWVMGFEFRCLAV